MHFLLITELQIFVVVEHDKKTSRSQSYKRNCPKKSRLVFKP